MYFSLYIYFVDSLYQSMEKNELCYRSAHYRWYVFLIGYDETNTTMISCFCYEVAMTQMQDATGVFCDGCVVWSSPTGFHWQTVLGGCRRFLIGKRCLVHFIDRFTGLDACNVTPMGNLR